MAAGEIIPGVRITLTATQTNQDNQPVFGILLLEYARPIANVDVDERIRQEVSVWAHTDDERPIPAEKLVTAHKAIPIPGNPTAADLNDIGPGIFLFTNVLPVLGIPIGTWLLTSNQTEDASVDLYQEAKRLGGGDPVTYFRRKITGTWVNADLFSEVETSGSNDGGLNQQDVDNRIATWARISNQAGTADIPDDAISNNIARTTAIPNAPAVWAETGNTDDVPEDKIPDAIARTSAIPSAPATWAETGNTDDVPEDKIPDAIARTSAIPSAPATWAREGDTSQIPTDKLGNAPGITTEQAAAIEANTAKFSAETWARVGDTSLIPANKLPEGMTGGGTPIDVPENYVHIGTPDLSSTTVTGVVSGADNIKPSVEDTLERFNVRFDNTLTGFNIPTAATYNTANGDIVLPAGHWIICSSLNIVASGATNSRVQADLSINHGTNQRHSQAIYLRGDGSFFGSLAVNDSQGKVSITGAVISDGVTPVRIRVAVARQDNPANIWIRGAHIHGYRQLIGGGSSGGGDGGFTETQIRGFIQDWAESGNSSQIPVEKIPNSIARTDQLPDVSNFVTGANVDQAIQNDVQVWARDDSTQIPEGKLENAPGLNQQAVDGRIAIWARDGNTDIIPPEKTDVVAWALNGDTSRIPDNKIPDTIARDDEIEIWARDTTTAIPPEKLTNAPGGLSQTAVNNSIATWARAANEAGTTDIPEDAVPDTIARTSQVDTAITDSVQVWARDDSTVIPANKIPEAHINFEESLFDTLVVGQVNDAIYRVNPITQEFVRIGNTQGFGVNEFNPTAIANINGTVYVTGERRKLIRLNIDEDSRELTGAGTEVAADNTLPEGIQGMTDRLGELIAAVDDPHSTAVYLIDIDKATGLSSNSRALTGTTQIADITTSPTGEIHGCCPIGTVWNLCLINPLGGAIIPVGAFTSNGVNVTINTLWWEGNTLKGISNEIGDDDIFVIDPSTGAMRELAMTNAFGVGEFLPKGAVSVPHYQSLPVAVSWARQENTDQIPANKLQNAPGLLQDGVDNRVRILVEDWAETGNTAVIPANKLTNANAAAYTATRIQGTGSAINGFTTGRASFVIPDGSIVLGLIGGEYLLDATISNIGGVHLNQEATNATTNQKFIRHNLSGVWNSNDRFSFVTAPPPAELQDLVLVARRPSQPPVVVDLPSNYTSYRFIEIAVDDEFSGNIYHKTITTKNFARAVSGDRWQVANQGPDHVAKEINGTTATDSNFDRLNRRSSFDIITAIGEHNNGTTTSQFIHYIPESRYSHKKQSQRMFSQHSLAPPGYFKPIRIYGTSERVVHMNFGKWMNTTTNTHRAFQIQNFRGQTNDRYNLVG